MNADDLKRARAVLGWSQDRLGKELGWKGNRQVSKLETGKAEITGQTALAVERLLIREGVWESYARGFGGEE